MSEPYSGWFGLVYGVQHHFQQYFSYIMVVSFTGAGNQIQTWFVFWYKYQCQNICKMIQFNSMLKHQKWMNFNF